MTLGDQLERGLVELGLSVKPSFADQLLVFMDDLLKWNKVYNLTSITKPDQVLTQHLLDSLSIHDYMDGASIIDVGTGGGFPGIPLAMYYQDASFSLLDSSVKKTRFLQQMVINHQLKNCSVVHSRAEDHDKKYDRVVCRAFASLPKIIQFSGHLVSENGKLLAMKGQLGPEIKEVEESGLGFQIVEVKKLQVPGLNAERHLVVLERVCR